MKLDNFRILMPSWLLVPIIMVWLSTSYLMGLTRKPVWETSANPKDAVLSATAVNQANIPEIERIHWENKGLVTLWFDDAWLSQFTTALPLLEDHSMVGALAVPTGMVGFDDYMSWNQIGLLQSKGWEIASHTVSHSCEPDELTEEFLDKELKQSLADLNTHGIRALHFVTPCGTNSDLIPKIAKNYYISLRTTVDGFNPLPVSNPYALKVQAVEWNTTPEQVAKWLEEARKKKYWLILMFHQIQNEELRFATTPARLAQMLDLIRGSDLKVVLPTQATQLIIDTEMQEATPEAKR